MPIEKNQLANLPNKPGVYYFYDNENNLLYIGKAGNLRRRVTSYFQKAHERRIEKLVETITTIKHTVTDSVLEALILEANEIGKYQPPFNVRQKDDKTFVTIAITDEKYPRVLIVRPTHKHTTPIKWQYGPYPSTDQARTAIELIRRIFPFRTKCQPKEKGNRGCLDYQIGLCPGPCTGKLSVREYAKNIRHVRLFLESKKNILSSQLSRDMTKAARELNFELAARLRNQLFALQHIRDVALLKKEREYSSTHESNQRIEAYDISNIGADFAVGSMVVFTQGAPDRAAYRKFRIKTVIGQNDVAMMEEVLTRRFRHIEWPLPRLILVDGGKGHLRIALRVLQQAKLSIPVIAVAKGPDRKKLDLYPSQPTLLDEPRLSDLIHAARDEAHRFAIRYHRHIRDKNYKNADR